MEDNHRFPQRRSDSWQPGTEEDISAMEAARCRTQTKVLRNEALRINKGKFKPPPSMTTLVEKRNAGKFCKFHGEVGHTTDECMHLKRQIEEMLKAGKLSHLIKELKQNNGKDQEKVAKKGEAARKDKPLAILMVQSGRKIEKQRITQTFSPETMISLPPLGEEDETEGPMVIEAEDEGFSDVNVSYIGGLWVLLELTSMDTKLNLMNHIGVKSWFHTLQEACDDFVSDERIVWVDIEGVPLKAWSRETFTRIGKIWGETLDLEENADSSFGRKRLCIKTKHVTSILETFKLIVKGRVYMVRAKELFTWNPTFLEYKEREYSSDVESAHASINNELNRPPNGEEPDDEFMSDEDGVPETIFGSSSLVPNHRDEDKDAAHSDDPFGLYDLLKNKKGTTNHVPSPSLSHPPGFTPVTSENRVENLTETGAPKVFNAQVMNSSQDSKKVACNKCTYPH
ncbi:RNA-directed DNA polymerase, eukaryota [Tanacetum coccineum]